MSGPTVTSKAPSDSRLQRRQTREGRRARFDRHGPARGLAVDPRQRAVDAVVAQQPIDTVQLVEPGGHGRAQDRHVGTADPHGGGAAHGEPACSWHSRSGRALRPLRQRASARTRASPRIIRRRTRSRGRPAGTWKLRSPVGDQARNCASFSGSRAARGRSMRKTLKRQRRPALGGNVVPDGALGHERAPRQEGDDGPADRAGGGIAAAGEPGSRGPLASQSLSKRPSARSTHRSTTVFDGVPLELGVRAAGRAHVEEQLDDLLGPKARVALR